MGLSALHTSLIRGGKIIEHQIADIIFPVFCIQIWTNSYRYKMYSLRTTNHNLMWTINLDGKDLTPFIKSRKY